MAIMSIFGHMETSRRYRHLFFDLDRTLWDFDRSSKATISTFCDNYSILPHFDEFYPVYHEINLELWAKYREGSITKDDLSLHRFWDSLRHFQIDDKDFAHELSEAYIMGVSEATFLFPDAIEVVKKLSEKYTLHIITNGFAEVQYRKLEASSLRPFFTQIITSEEAGFQKPDPAIFELALQRAGASAADSFMIGDDPDVDLVPAAALGMDLIFVNHDRCPYEGKFTHHVFSLKEILEII